MVTSTQLGTDTTLIQHALHAKVTLQLVNTVCTLRVRPAPASYTAIYIHMYEHFATSSTFTPPKVFYQITRIRLPTQILMGGQSKHAHEHSATGSTFMPPEGFNESVY